ncbi:hypothetical protein E4U14_006062 [Claviceps sp. LM454 group G7]|nr:hypothetical protein E4U14_006062 [Claviceps sp. LM454 group G7]
MALSAQTPLHSDSRRTIEGKNQVLAVPFYITLLCYEPLWYTAYPMLGNYWSMPIMEPPRPTTERDLQDAAATCIKSASTGPSPWVVIDIPSNTRP